MISLEFERILNMMLTGTQHTILTLTEVPDSDDDLTQILEKAIARGNHLRSRLTKINLPMRQYPNMGTRFGYVPIEDTGAPNVVRLFFQPY